MSVDIIEKILEMLHQESLLGQNCSVKKVSITSKKVLFHCENKEPIYCCPRCQQQTFLGYDSTCRLIEDLPTRLRTQDG